MNPASPSRVDGFLFEFKRWAATEKGIQAVALIGSHARNAATDESDVDLIVVITQPNIYLRHKQWTSLFGNVDRMQTEDYGRCTSLRVWYSVGFEVEYGFVDESWCALPLNEDTRQIATEGMKVLFERHPSLSLLV
jgi:predicted nucleotidyltransferase